MRDVAGELPGPVDRDGLRCLTGFVQDLDLAALHDEELEVTLAASGKRFAIPVLLKRGLGAASKLDNLGLLERGEGDGAQIILSHVSTSFGRCALLIRIGKALSQPTQPCFSPGFMLRSRSVRRRSDRR